MTTTSKHRPKPKRTKNVVRQSNGNSNSIKDVLQSSTLPGTQRDLADDEDKETELSRQKSNNLDQTKAQQGAAFIIAENDMQSESGNKGFYLPIMCGFEWFDPI